MLLRLLQNFTGKICLFFINQELYFFSQLLKYYMLHGLIYSFLRIWDFKNKWEMCWSEIGKQLDLLYIRFKRGAKRELTRSSRASGLVHI